MNTPSLDPNNLLIFPKYKEPEHEVTNEAIITPATVRQNIASEAKASLNYSFKYNVILLLIALGKIAATMTVFFNTENLCFAAREVWLFCVMVYDIFYASLTIMMLQNIRQMDHLVRKHAALLSYTPDPHPPTPPDSLSSVHQESSSSEGEEFDEVREYDVEQSHRNNRIASLSRKAAKARKLIIKVSRTSDSIYFLIFIVGQVIFFFAKASHCDTKAINSLVVAYIAMGYVWILTPLVLLIIGLLCYPMFLCCIFVFGRGNQGPASSTDISKLHVKTYTPDQPGNKECLICMLEYHEGDKIVQLECHETHHYHETCIKRWLKLNGQCPACRMRLDEMGTETNDQQREWKDEESQL